jgi:tRNA threonylcarbamoyladenosine biosynthesis protein TsaB
MITLAFETTTDRLSVAGRNGPGGRVASRSFEGARMHAARLFPLIEEVLHDLDAGPAEVDSLAVADGPGSFTGLRVGWAAARAMAQARPAISVWTASALMVRAAGAAAPRGARILVVTTALRGDLYAASYRLDLPGTVETLTSPTLASPESLHRETPDMLVADAPDKLVDRLADQFQVPLVRGTASQPSAAALLGLIGVAGGAARLGVGDGREPFYGRPAEAQARWEKAHGHTLPDPSGGAR